MITETVNAIPEHATFREVERVFGIPPETTKRLIVRQLVRAVKVSHRILVDLSSLRAYLASLPVVMVAEAPSSTRCRSLTIDDPPLKPNASRKGVRQCRATGAFGL
jgi:hypothetical protein